MHTVQDVRTGPAELAECGATVSEITLSRKEFDLLHALMSQAGEIVSRDQLMHEVWDTTFWTSAKTIDVHLGWVRRKLGDDTRRPTLITTIRGKGLRFETGPATPRTPSVNASVNGRQRDHGHAVNGHAAVRRTAVG